LVSIFKIKLKFKLLINLPNFLIVNNSRWISFEQVIMQYFNGCVYAAGTRKANKEIEAPSEDELKYVQVEGLVKHRVFNRGNHNR